MSLDLFDWDKDTGAGRPSSFSTRLQRPLARSPKGTGIVQVRPQHSIPKWVYTLNFSWQRPQGYIYLYDFFHAHPGQNFYFQWPFALYGIPGFGGEPQNDPTNIWDTAIATGFGMGPVKICWFDMDEIGHARKNTAENYWTLETPLIIAER